METAVQQKSDDDLQALIDDSPAAPVESSPPPAPSNDGSDIDALLREFQEKTAQPEPADNVSENQETTNDDLDRLLAEINGPDPKVAELQGQIDAFKASEFQAQERQAALKWAADLQEVVSSSNPNCESDFVVRELKVLSADNPGLLEQAWQYRGLTDAQLAIAQKDSASAEKLYQRVLAEPDSEKKRNAIRYLQQQGAQLQAMLGARSVIRSAQNAIRKRAESVKAAYDPDVSATRMELAQLIRDGGSNRQAPPEPPPQLGRLSEAEFRKYTLENFGF